MNDRVSIKSTGSPPTPPYMNLVDICGQTIQRDGMIINSHQGSKKHYFVTTGTDCHLTMLASSPKEKVQFYFRFFLVYSLLRVAPLNPAPLIQESSHGSASLNLKLQPTSSSSPDDPCFAGSYLQFYDGRDMRSPPLGPPLCGKTPPKPVLSTGQYLTLRLVTRGTQPRVDFVGDFTSLRLGFSCRHRSDGDAQPGQERIERHRGRACRAALPGSALWGILDPEAKGTLTVCAVRRLFIHNRTVSDLQRGGGAVFHHSCWELNQ
ncbi:PREDICTED: low-density lipoprotein receptor class A domain-containing protein 2 [Cyprinodon variegatus]|uniref:low-density lipoprotein receptor class A domain-containing protein 2 n=1 Tax=Cyprinodon variegatus TaxID=28743 RepID=UPI000742892B|nr:PREDICTED: low-density lipoprotein receptor class A domain-containing protein 2 [Cyprinodon variegatus]